MTETIKILLIGNSSAGKSSLLLRFVHNTWEPEDAQATIGVDFKSLLLPLPDRRDKVKLTLWDTAGQERFRTLTSSYYRGAQGVLVLFDLTARPSFEQVPHWFAELLSHASTTKPVTYLIGSKLDRAGQRAVSRDEAENLAGRHDARYFEVSAKTGEGVREVFTQLAQDVLDGLVRETGRRSADRGDNRVTLDDDDDKDKHDGTSCAC